MGLVAALSIFLGLAFEETYKRNDRTSPGGIRTFPILALGGAMLYLIEPRNALAFVAGLIAVAMWLYAALQVPSPRETGTSLMVPASNLLAYTLGPIALTQPYWVVVAVSVVAALLLGAREKLHGLITLLPTDEVFTASQFLILVGVVLPLVPDQPLTPLASLTPYQVWLAVVAVCALSYLGYLIQKYVPFRNAALFPAILGGVYSSTATTIVLAKQQRDTHAGRPELTAGIVAATAIMYVRLGVVIALFNRDVAMELAPVLVGLFLLGVAIATYEWDRADKQKAVSNLDVAPRNPLQLQTAAVFAVLFVVISIVSAWTKATFGSLGLFAIALVVGVTDIDPYVINIAQGGVHGLSLGTLSAAILIAASSNNIIKAVYA
ncbi:MAG: DUF4010 domain-containing protein, partial [Alphaproteobacteria bacterium]|nr:DUF4010 domain-containing protein [Alphaproteobacteria bacterium]